jgi:hypothetical protein
MQTINRSNKLVKENVAKLIYTEYENNGIHSAIDFVEEYNKQNNKQIPFEWCEPCDNIAPSIDHECCCCGHKTKKLKFKFSPQNFL